jgi:hypothetical protein
MKSIYLVLSLIALISATLSGCNCYHDDAVCMPCVNGAPAGNKQNKGCVYKACMAAMYICLQVPSNKGVNATVVDTGNRDADDWNKARADTVCARPRKVSSGAGSSSAFNPQELESFMNNKEKLQQELIEALTKSGITGSSYFYDGTVTSSAPATKTIWFDFLRSHNLEADGYMTANGNCVDIAGIKYDENVFTGEGKGDYGANASDFSLNSSPLGDGPNGTLSGPQRAGIQSAMSKFTPSGPDPSCSHLDPNGDPSATISIDTNGGAQALSDARQLFGGHPNTGMAKNESGPTGGGAATAADTPSGGLAPSNHTQGGLSNGSGITPFSPVAGGSGSGSGSSDTGSKNLLSQSSGAATGADGADNGLADAAGPGAINTGDAGYGAVARGGGGGQGGSGSPFASLFGGGGSGGGPTTGGAAAANFGLNGGAAGGAEDFDSYLSKNGKVSLFEIVNNRTQRFSRDIQY